MLMALMPDDWFGWLAGGFVESLSVGVGRSFYLLRANNLWLFIG